MSPHGFGCVAEQVRSWVAKRLEGWNRPRRPRGARPAECQLSAERLEAREVLATLVGFDVGTGTLSITLEGNQTASLSATALGAVQVSSSDSIEADANAEAIGFEDTGGSISDSNTGIFGTITSIVIFSNGSDSAVYFDGGDFEAAVTVDSSVAVASFTAVQSFNELTVQAYDFITVSEDLLVDDGDLSFSSDEVYGEAQLSVTNGNVGIEAVSYMRLEGVSTTPDVEGQDAGNVSLTLYDGSEIVLSGPGPVIDTRSLDNLSGDSGFGGDVTIRINTLGGFMGALVLDTPDTIITSSGDALDQAGEGGSVTIGDPDDYLEVVGIGRIVTSGGDGLGASGMGGAAGSIEIFAEEIILDSIEGRGGAGGLNGGDGAYAQLVANYDDIEFEGDVDISGGDGGDVAGVAGIMALSATNDDIYIGGVLRADGGSGGTGGRGGVFSVYAYEEMEIGAISANGGSGSNSDVDAANGGQVGLFAGYVIDVAYEISANGGDTVDGIAGSGGEIYIRLEDVEGVIELGLDGTIAITANGGNSGDEGGAGGHVEIDASTDFSYVATRGIQANGGLASPTIGEAGSIHIVADDGIDAESTFADPFSALGAVVEGGDITFDAAVYALTDGGDLIVTASSYVDFYYEIGDCGCAYFDEIDITAPEIYLNYTVVSLGNQSYHGATILDSDVYFSSQADVFFDGTLDSGCGCGSSAIVDTPGLTTFGDDVGLNLPLYSLVTLSGGETRFLTSDVEGGEVYTLYEQVYYDDIHFGDGFSENVILSSDASVVALFGHVVIDTGYNFGLATYEPNELYGTLTLNGGSLIHFSDGGLIVYGLLEGNGEVSTLSDFALIEIAAGGILSPGLGGVGAAGSTGTIEFISDDALVLVLQPESIFAVQVAAGTPDHDSILLNGPMEIAAGALLDLYVNATPGAFPVDGFEYEIIQGTIVDIDGLFEINAYGAVTEFTLTAPDGVDEGVWDAEIGYEISRVFLTFTDLTPPPPPPPAIDVKHFAVSADQTNSGPHVVVYDAARQVAGSFYAFSPKFRGGVRVAVGDVNDDGVDDVIVAAGPGGKSWVKVIDGTKLGQTEANGMISDSALLAQFYAFGKSFKGGVYVAAGDVNQDGHAEIIVGAGEGAKGKVRVFDGQTFGASRNFNPFGGSYRGGVTVAAGDLNGDGAAEIVTGRATGKSQIRIFDGASAARIASYFAFGKSFSGGVYVATGDVDGDGDADVVAGKGAGSKPTVAAFAGATRTKLASFNAFSSSFRGGVRVATANVDGDAADEILAAPGPNSRPRFRLLNLDASVVDQIMSVDGLWDGGLFGG